MRSFSITVRRGVVTNVNVVLLSGGHGSVTQDFNTLINGNFHYLFYKIF